MNSPRLAVVATKTGMIGFLLHLQHRASTCHISLLLKQKRSRTVASKASLLCAENGEAPQNDSVFAGLHCLYLMGDHLVSLLKINCYPDRA
jgi:hypothetical protein